MNNNQPKPGTPVNELDTPALLVDMNAVDSNYRAVAKTYNNSFCKMRQHTKNIKSLLLDQKFVSGIGNIYANEILFHSKVNPQKKAFQVNSNEMKKLIKFSRHILELAIQQGGSTIKNFKNAKGYSGSFQKKFKVYDRENESCLRKSCNGKIIKKFISNRSTFFCKLCQI